jgi:Arc/MetJ-type ribon-helix-helix transcriptional regulator
MGMDIQVGPELEDLVRQHVERGTYQSVDEYVGHAVSLLHAQATWFAEDRAEISSEISARFAAARPVS